MDTGAIVAVTVQDASDGDTATLPETLITAAEQVEAVQPNGVGVEEVVADKAITATRRWSVRRESRPSVLQRGERVVINHGPLWGKSKCGRAQSPPAIQAAIAAPTCSRASRTGFPTARM